VERVNQDPRVKKLLRSVIMLAVFAVGLFVYNLFSENPLWMVSVVLLLGTVVNTVRWIMTKKNVMKEIMAKQSSEAQP
jgi:F0F1-type ATP synthase assembly protein I